MAAVFSRPGHAGPPLLCARRRRLQQSALGDGQTGCSGVSASSFPVCLHSTAFWGGGKGNFQALSRAALACASSSGVPFRFTSTRGLDVAVEMDDGMTGQVDGRARIKTGFFSLARRTWLFFRLARLEDVAFFSADRVKDVFLHLTRSRTSLFSHSTALGATCRASAASVILCHPPPPPRRAQGAHTPPCTNQQLEYSNEQLTHGCPARLSRGGRPATTPFYYTATSRPRPVTRPPGRSVTASSPVPSLPWRRRRRWRPTTPRSTRATGPPSWPCST